MSNRLLLLICSTMLLSACASSALPLIVSHMGLENIMAETSDKETSATVDKQKLYVESNLDYTISNAKRDYARMDLSNGYNIAVQDWKNLYLPLLDKISAKNKDIIVDGFSRMQWYYDARQELWLFTPKQGFESPYYRHSWIGAVGNLSLATRKIKLSIAIRRYGATLLRCNRIAIAYDKRKWDSNILAFEASNKLPGWEQTLLPYSDFQTITLLYDILQAHDIRIRFYGVQYYDELRLQGKGKIIDNLRRILNAVQLLQSLDNN
ncbi:MAG: hypothetical protein R8K21_08780 [Mariprofundales bacterium]